MRLVELASGVDALYLSGRGTVQQEWLENLDSVKEQAREEETTLHMQFGGEDVLVSPSGWGKYRYSLEHPNGRLGFTPSVKIPAVRVQPRAHFLHGCGPEAAVDWFNGLVSGVVDGLEWQTARLDLFVDLQGWVPGMADRDRFVTRARSVDMHERDGRFTGFSFGQRAGGGMASRIYDKTTDVARTGADYWYDIWGTSFQKGSPVFRTEFEFGRTVLRDLGIGSPSEALASVGNIWAYGVDWLSFRSPTGDTTRSRWPLAPEWVAISEASLRGGAIGLKRAQEGMTEGSIRKLLPTMCGTLAKFAFLTGCDDLDSTIHGLGRWVRRYDTMSGIPFEARILQKSWDNRWS